LKSTETWKHVYLFGAMLQISAISAR